MKKNVRITIALCSALLGACAQTQVVDGPVTRVSKDYEAMGDATGIRPFIYGKRTLIEFKNPPYGLTVKDENGATVGYQKEGRYYALDRKLNDFTISSGGREIAFSLAPPDEPPLGPLMDTKETAADETAANLPPVELQAHTSPQTQQEGAAFRVMKDQLKQYRQLLKKAENDSRITGDELHALNSKLDGMEKKMAAGTAIVHVYFDHLVTNPVPNDKTLRIAINAAKGADRINIYGRTSAQVAGKIDPQIAMDRAVNIKKFMVDHGVSEVRTYVTSLPSGDFIVSPNLKEGDGFNRRVAIEIIREP